MIKQPITFIPEIDNIIYEFATNDIAVKIQKLVTMFKKGRRTNQFFQYVLNRNYARVKKENKYRVFTKITVPRIGFQYPSFKQYTYEYYSLERFLVLLHLPPVSSETWERNRRELVTLKDLYSTQEYDFTKTFFLNNFIVGCRNNNPRDIIFKSKNNENTKPAFGVCTRIDFWTLDQLGNYMMCRQSVYETPEKQIINYHPCI